MPPSIKHMTSLTPQLHPLRPSSPPLPRAPLNARTRQPDLKWTSIRAACGHHNLSAVLNFTTAATSHLHHSTEAASWGTEGEHRGRVHKEACTHRGKWGGRAGDMTGAHNRANGIVLCNPFFILLCWPSCPLFIRSCHFLLFTVDPILLLFYSTSVEAHFFQSL